MVKFGKNKFRALNKLAKQQKAVSASPGVSNKVLKKKINADKKVTFQKEILIKEAVTGDNKLVKNVTAKEIVLNELSKTTAKKPTAANKVPKPKQKPVQKQRKRKKTQLNDTKLLLSLMKKNK